MFVLYFLFALLAQDGLASVSRVAHGEPTAPHEFPHHVAIFIKRFPQTPEYFYCGGSIITPKWILTAGNCVPKVGKLIVKAGKHYINIKESYEQDRSVVNYIVHEKYVGRFQSKKLIPKNDIALLQLNSPLIFNHYIKPIALPSFNDIKNNFGKFCGWGSISQGLFPKYPEKLHSTELEIVDNTNCADAINSGFFDSDLFNIKITNGQICTSYTELGGGPCFYDTGNGFIQYTNNYFNNVTAEIVGIFSWTKSPCGQYGKPAVFTRVLSYIDWIQAHITDA